MYDGAILTVVSVYLAIRFALQPRPSVRAKLAVAGLEVTSFLVPWLIPAILMQLTAGLWVLLHLKATGPAGSSIRLR